MIVWNEAEVLAQAVESTRGLADEVVVLDTGSTDDTVAVAQRLGCRVLTDGDRMHKSRSRNRVQDAALGEWIVVLDADEQIAGPSDVREFLEGTDAQAVYVRLVYMDDDDQPILSYRQMRCWKKGTFKYKYRAHEVPIAVNGQGKIAQTDFVWEHRPPPGRKWKLQYILDLLEMDVAENPGEPRPLFYLGRQYVYAGKWEKGIETLNLYLDAPDHDEADGWAYLAQCYEALDDVSKQISALFQACAKRPERREWWGRLAGVYHTRGENWLAIGLLKCALEIPAPMDTYVAYLWYGAHIYDLLARCLWGLKRYEEGHRYAKKAVELSPDNERLRKNLAFFEEKVR